MTQGRKLNRRGLDEVDMVGPGDIIRSSETTTIVWEYVTRKWGQEDGRHKCGYRRRGRRTRLNLCLKY